MINRILIRIKVVQILYSYLLTKGEFKLETFNDNISRDKKYASSFYFDLILLILKLSGYNIGNKANITPSLLQNCKIAKLLINNNDIKALIAKENHNVGYYDNIISDLNNLIISSSVYKDFAKKKSTTLEDEVTLWNVIIGTIFLKNEKFVSASRQNEGFTLNGFELGSELLMNSLSELCDNRMSLTNARTALSSSLDKSYELYFCILNLMIELTKLQAENIKNAKNKFLPTLEDLNPNTKFIDNKLIDSIINNPNFEEGLSKTSINWAEEPILLRNILNSIITSDAYNEYMSSNDSSLASDCDLWKNILKNIIFNNDDFIELLESKSSFWNDDLHIIGTFVIKTIKQFANNPESEISPISQFKDEEDAKFGITLFDETITNFETYRSYIDKFISKQWDSDRLAFMDIVIMTTAIAEMLKFPLIPIPVTLNEYIEIANSYSTAKSGQFINGILYSVINHLKSEGKLNK